MRLTAASSLLNVPVNLLIDLINIPHNEVRALDYTARAFLFSGPWFVVGPTNVWGVDPGDPPKFMSLVNMLVPFPALSGIDLDEFDQSGLGQQVWFYVATQLPTSVHCDDEGCMPTVPTAPITGIAIIDSTIWSLAILTGQVKFPLFDNWFKVPISDLTSGYTFGPDYPGRVNPAGLIYPGFGFPGTTVDPVTGEHIMPWDGMTFTLDLSKPVANYFDHLMADPATNPIKLPDLEQFGRAIQSLAAAMVVAFYPFTPGSFFCPGDCSFLPPALNYPGIVKSIGDLWPGNVVIDEWLEAYENGKANVPTEEQVDLAIKLKEGHFWSFGHPRPPADWSNGFDLTTLAPHFHALWTALGLNPPPLEEDPGEETESVDAFTGDPANELLASESVSEERVSDPTLASATTPNAVTMNSDAVPVAPDSQMTNNVFTEAQQDDQSSTPAVTEAPNAATVPNDVDPAADQTPATDTTRDGNMAVPAGLGAARHSAGERRDTGADLVSRVLERVNQPATGFGADANGGRGSVAFGNGGEGRAAGQTGGNRADTNTGDTKVGETDSGGGKAGESDTGGSNSGEGSNGSRHRAE